MKHFALILFFISFIGITNAQTTKGTFAVGFHNFSSGQLATGSLAYNLFPQTNALGISFVTSKDKYDGQVDEEKQKSVMLGLSLNAQYFAVDHLAIGLTANLATGNSKTVGNSVTDNKSSFTILLVGPELRYYFDPGAQAKCCIKGGAAFGSLSSKYEGESGDPIGLSQFGGGAGVSLFPIPAVSIDFGLGYNVFTVTEKDEVSGDYQSINSGLAIDIGAGFFF
jgi:hypothetical protein